ncbi:beta-lactamase family protein [Gracilibacillus oryzae]|uniref:Beta-lactamase family protein n=1 Tax=Gracilibacillus oryzae TaxID=1672701 RepID=A0A7C8L895_9BACI|nr:serine hydrolase domain-containing protein [Gracilibacillus oryzae]KAB8138022.1 beta-lactamase family protein [Gracilibacillus oryzae]
MKSYIKILLVIIAVIISGLMPQTVHAEADERIKQFVEEQREISEIPGISLVIVEKGKTVFQEGFGYADIDAKTPVTSHTLFELGSTAKAFTALAILQLEKEGLLQRSDNVQKYIPWLELEYNGEPQTITIDQLLHHTSGIASKTIVHIPESNAENALEETVRTLLDQHLNRKPGSSFEYATINYDVLGLVIEKVAKQPYDTYIKQQILEKANMQDSYAGLHQVKSDEMATGYKIGWMSAQQYIPPIYRGNIPAGYVISNPQDIAEWMKLQLGNNPDSPIDRQLIQQSHVPDQSVEPFDKNTYYASGWSVMTKDDQKYIYHAGENPTFSSYIIMQPDKQLGVAVLSNMNSSFTPSSGQNVLNLWEGKNISTNHTDSYQKIDQIATIACIVVCVIGVLFLLFSMRVLRQIITKKRSRAVNVRRIIFFIIHVLVAVAVWIMIIWLPKIPGMTWKFIEAWAPVSVTTLLYMALAASLLYFLLGVLLILTRKSRSID